MLNPDVQAPQIEKATVPAGPFIMGEGEGQPGGNSSVPAHKVVLEEYQLSRYPVTNAQFRVFAKDSGHSFTDGPDDHPVSGLAWHEAWLFAAWMRYKTGAPYHLPTEAEWEKAASWNPKTNRKQAYPWGDQLLENHSNSGRSAHKGKTPVTLYSPQADSPYGCADMIGNVEEWCNSVMAPYPYDATDDREELTMPGRRAIRGGDYFSRTPNATERHAPSDAWRSMWGCRLALGPALDIAHAAVELRISAWLEKAKPLYQERIDRDPSDPQAWYDRGTWEVGELIKFGVEASADADRDLTRAVELATYGSGRSRLLAAKQKSPLQHVFFNRAIARYRLAQNAPALEDIRRAIALVPNDIDAYLLRADILSTLGDWKAARRDLERALKTDPRRVINPLVEARILAAQKNHTGAIQLLTAVMDHTRYGASQVMPDAHLYRGQLREQSGQTEGAMSDYCHYLLWKPDAVEADSLQQKLAQYRQTGS